MLSLLKHVPSSLVGVNPSSKNDNNHNKTKKSAKREMNVKIHG